MKNTYGTFVKFLLIILFSNSLYPAYNTSLSIKDLVFPINNKSDNYISSDTPISKIAEALTKIKSDTSDQKIYLVYFDSTFSNLEAVDSIIDEYQLRKNVISDFSASVLSQLQSGKNLLIITSNSDAIITDFNDILNQFSPTDQDTFSIITAFEQPIFNIWHRTGKLPNVIFAEDEQNYKQLEETCKKINSYTRIFGTVTYKNKPLENVRWMEFPGLVTTGDFSVPLHNNRRTHLSPVKEGYKFSPDIVYYIPENFDRRREYRAYLMDISDKMIADFDFEKNIYNKIDGPNDKLLLNNVKIIKDTERGNVAWFSGENSYIDCDNTIDFGNQTEMTVALWIKPDMISQNHSFVGKGLDFSFKIHFHSPAFTTADIKDHFQPDIHVDSSKWQHIAMVVKENESVKFYKNGTFAGLVDASEINKSDKSVMIGTNLWEEFYIGYMDDLKMWNRALNEIEILNLYNLASKPTFPLLQISLYFFWFAIVIAAIIAIKKIPFQALKNQPSIEYQNSIFFFGNLKINTGNVENLQNDLSPKLKQIFVLLLIYSIKENGISTKKLTDILWPGFTPDKAKNNRSTYFGKLRNFLKKIDGLDLVYKNKKWTLDFNQSVYIDYFELNNILLNQSIVDNGRLIALLSRGQLLPEIECDWLDEYRLELTQKLDKYLEEFLNRNNIQKQPEIAYELATQIKKFDSLSETALALQIKSQTISGNHSLAKKCYDSFCKDYNTLYGTKYEKEFQEFI